MQSNSELFLEERENNISERDWQDAWEQERLKQFEQEDTLSVIKPFDQGLKKSQIEVMASNAVDSVLELGNPLKVAESISAMELFIKTVKDNPRFKEYVREEASKTPKGFVSSSGAKIELAEVGSTYDYSNCGDAELDMLDADFKKAENNLKERKEFLKKIPLSGIDVIVPFSGEVIHIYPPSKSSTSSYKVNLAK